jgi:hypothetical protein
VSRGYGIANYGDGKFGVTTYVDASASASVTALTAVIGGEVFYGSTAISASTSGVAAGVFVIEGAAQDATAVSTVASAAVEVFDGLASMGGSAVGSSGSAIRVREASAATAVGITSATASLQFITNASADTSASASVTALAKRVALGLGGVAVTTTVSASANITAHGVSLFEPSSTTSINYIRERSVAVAPVVMLSSVMVNGIEKWEAFTPVSETWTTILAVNETWTKIAA